MLTDCISIKDTGFFSSLMCDYLDELPELKSFYNQTPKIENFKIQIQEKQSTVQTQSRSILNSVLKKQYSNIDASDLTKQNIDSLKQNNSFTITTGHQLNLFTGPLYFLYKIISTINLTQYLKANYPDYNFVPIYWMATEDHDFDEINYFNFKGKEIQWNINVQGAVGQLSTSGLQDVLQVFKTELGSSPNAEFLKTLFENAYLKHNNLADATRFLVNQLFKNYGLVILDADDADLKKQFIPFLEEEITSQLAFKKVSQTNRQINNLPKNYNIQVNPRNINLFYLDAGLRERIVFNGDAYSVLNTNITWKRFEILEEIQKHPEKFSPNVLMRPLYQEVILPNLCYIGGGGELAYWLQLKSYFDAVEVPFPILLLRNSVLIQSKKQAETLKKLNISNQDIFLEKQELINKKVGQISAINIDFSAQKNHLKQQFEDLYKLAEQTDTSFLGAVSAQERKQIKGLEHLEKRLLKAQKRKLSDQVLRVSEIKNQLFPSGNLQERTLNFSELYLDYGQYLIPTLFKHLQPLQDEFLVLSL